jgi:hypothetical protein
MEWTTSRKRTTRRVLVHGLPYFGKIFAQLMSGDGWEFRFYPDQGLTNLTALAWELSACDIAYQIGGRVTAGKFLWSAKRLNKRRLVMHWAGSDALDERGPVALGKSDPWVVRQVHHWAESDWMVREVQELGLSCERIPLPSAAIPDQASPLPSQFSVLVHIPSEHLGFLYGLDRILQVARNLPQIPFELVGLKAGRISGAPNNLRVHGRIAELSKFYQQASVVWRPVRHDGLSFMVREALGHGRHVLYSYPFHGCVQVKGAGDAQKEIEGLYALHQLGQLRINETGRREVMEKYARNPLKQQILGRLEALLQS